MSVTLTMESITRNVERFAFMYFLRPSCQQRFHRRSTQRYSPRHATVIVKSNIRSKTAKGSFPKCFKTSSNDIGILQNHLQSSRTYNSDTRLTSSCQNPELNYSRKDAENHNFSRCKEFRSIPGPTGVFDLPYIGMSFHFKPFGTHTMEKASKLFLDLKKQYGPIMKQRIGAEHFVFLYDPEDFELVFKAEGPYPFREELHLVTTYCRRNGQPIGLNGLNGKAWSELRKPTQDKMLRPTVVSRFLPMMNEVTDDLIEIVREHGCLQDINKYMLNFALENAGGLAFNKRLGLLNEDHDADTLRSDFGVFFKLMSEHFFLPPLYKYFRTPFYRQFEKAANGLYTRFAQELRDAKTEMTNRRIEVSGPNLVQELLMDQRITSDKSVRAVLLDIFIAGGDTTSSTLSSLIRNLASHPRVQQKLYNEVKENIAPDGIVTESCLKRLSYLKCCIKESMRYLFPLPVGLARRSTKDLVIKNYNIPQNTYFVMCFNQVCKDPNIFKDPDMFIPERWSRDSEIRVRNPFTFLPFGFGTRSCLGQRFAEQEIQVCIAKLIEKFEFSLPVGMEDVDHVHKLFVYPEKPITVTFHPRLTSI